MLVAEKRLTVRDFLQIQFEGEDEVYENRAGSFEPFSYAEISGRIQSNVLPGFEVEIGEIFPNH